MGEYMYMKRFPSLSLVHASSTYLWIVRIMSVFGFVCPKIIVFNTIKLD